MAANKSKEGRNFNIEVRLKAIIPSAGFGRRLKMKSNQSKEMLPDNIFGYNHIIDYSLEICRRYNLEPIVISRKEKKDLNNYLKKLKVKTVIIKPEGEWNDSVLKSAEFWGEENILILPDTRWNNWSVIDDIKKGLELGNNAVFAVHKVNDPENWGVVNDYKLEEKSKNYKSPQMAWGLIAFKCNYGRFLFDDQWKIADFFGKNECFELSNCGFVYLNGFQDITRR